MKKLILLFLLASITGYSQKAVFLKTVSNSSIAKADSGKTTPGNYVTDAGIAKKLQNSISNGKAMQFDGANDYISFGTSTQLDLGTGDGTYFARFKNDGNDGADNNILNNQAAASTTGTGFAVSAAGYLTGFYYTAQGYVTSPFGTTNIGADGKIHSGAYTITRNSATGNKIYLDGKQEGISTSTLVITNPVTPTTAKNIGVGYNGNQDYFAGSIYAFKYFNCALTAQEIKDLSEGGSTPFKYVGASNTSLVTNGTDWTGGPPPTGWTAVPAGTIGAVAGGNPGNCVSLARNVVLGNYPWYEQAITVTIGKRYKYSVDIKNVDAMDGGQIGIGTSSASYDIGYNASTSTSWTNKSIEFTATTSTVYVYFMTYTYSGSQSCLFDNAKLISLGEILSLDAPGMSTATWYDQSSNAINGTVSGATLYDAPVVTNVKQLIHTTVGDIPLKIQATSSGLGAAIQFNTINNGGSTAQAWYLGGNAAVGDGDFSLWDITRNAGVITVNKTGNVGIGTTAPGSLLDVSGNSNGGSMPAIRISDTHVGSAGERNWAITNGYNAYGALDFQVSTAQGGNPVGGTTALTILNSGNIRALPTYSVHVGGTYEDLYIDNTGLIGLLSSSAKTKDSIADLNDVSWLYAPKLKVKTYVYKHDSAATLTRMDTVFKDTTYQSGTATGTTTITEKKGTVKEVKYKDPKWKGRTKQIGLLAEDVSTVKKELVHFDKDGQPEGIVYSKLIAPMLKAIQDQKIQIDSLNARVTRLEQKAKLLDDGKVDKPK